METFSFYVQDRVYTWFKIQCKSGGEVDQFWMQINIEGQQWRIKSSVHLGMRAYVDKHNFLSA